MAKAAAEPTINIAEDVGKPVGDLKRITELAQQLVESAAHIAKMENNLKLAKLEHEELEMVTLPAAMMECGLTKFTLTTGEIISADPYTRSSVPTLSAISKADEADRSEMMQRREDALNWLKSHNAASIIKNEITITFLKGQDDLAKQLYQQFLAEGLKAKCEESVNFQTLNAFVKETLKAGIDIPFETFSIFSGHKATIKKVK